MPKYEVGETVLIQYIGRVYLGKVEGFTKTGRVNVRSRNNLIQFLPSGRQVGGSTWDCGHLTKFSEERWENQKDINRRSRLSRTNWGQYAGYSSETIRKIIAIMDAEAKEESHE